MWRTKIYTRLSISKIQILKQINCGKFKLGFRWTRVMKRWLNVRICRDGYLLNLSLKKSYISLNLSNLSLKKLVTWGGERGGGTLSRKYWYTFRWSIHKIECSLIEMHKIFFYMTLYAQQQKQRGGKKACTLQKG